MKCPCCFAHNLEDRVHCWCCQAKLPTVPVDPPEDAGRPTDQEQPAPCAGAWKT